MQNIHPDQTYAHYIGAALLTSILVGILLAVFLVSGIDINMTANILETAENMQTAEMRLRAKAYFGLVTFALEALVAVTFFTLLRYKGPILAGWSLALSLAASIMMMFGAIYTMNAALIVSNSAFIDMATADQRLLLTGLQATSSYTAFHLALILASVANAGFFYLFLTSRLIPKPIALGGLLASLFVAISISLRDFIPVLDHNTVTTAFMLFNLIALVSLGLYLLIKGVRSPS